MTPHLVLLLVALAGLLVALAALAVTLVLWRRHAHTEHMLREHRRNHTGTPTHRPVEQRRPVPGPATGHLPAVGIDYEAGDGPATAEQPTTPPPGLPRPGQIGRPR